MASQVTGLSPEVLGHRSGVTLLGKSSLNAALAGAWDAPTARQEGLPRLVAEAESLVRWGPQHRGVAAQKAPLNGALQAIAPILPQALAPDPAGGGQRLRRGTVRDRLASVGDRAMRHGRKSTAPPLTGDTRHVRTLLGAKRVVDAVCQPANQAEHEALAT